MSDTNSQFSQQPMPSKQPSSQFSQEPLPTRPTPEALAPPPSVQRRLRLWPGVAILAVQWGAVKTIGYFTHGTPMEFMSAMMGPMIGSVLILIWWLFFSRLSWFDRLLIPAACVAFVAAVLRVADPSIEPMILIFYALPLAETGWIIWLVVSYPLVWLTPSYAASWQVRRAGLLLGLLLVCGYFTLIRFEGVTGTFEATINWRWTPSAEDIFMAERTATKAPAKEVKPLVLQAGDWPGFRGPNRDSRLTGVKIATDWDKNPPKLLWKHKVGPGWGSFTVIGKHVFTQEQWGPHEAIVCYDADTGEPIWDHQDEARFTEAIAGPGPRATPTFHEGKLYTMGAAGKLCCLDAASGRLLWSQEIRAATEAKLPQWGFAASPLVMQGKVMVFAGGADKCVVAYDAETGKLAWAAGKGDFSYSSLQAAKIDGVEQALMMTGEGMMGMQPSDGAVLWNYDWNLKGAARCVQPGAIGDAEFLIGSPFTDGTRRLRVEHKDGKWESKQVWASRAIDPYFNDFVTHREHLYGFTSNGAFFACVGLEKGKSAWKERGYGAGQVLLLADQDLLLIATEQGDVAVVEANPKELKELTRFKAIDGKTWNHPVVAHGRLYIRNGEEAACYQLSAP